MIKDSVTKRLAKKKWVFSRDQLEKFGKSINKYRKNVTLEDGSIVSVFDWETIYLKAGVKTKDGKVTWYGSEDDKIFHIEKFDEMYRQWHFMMYGDNEKLVQLEETSEGIDANKVFENY